MSTLKWKAANIYSTTNSTETNSTSILPTSAVTYALAQSINEMGDNGMYLTRFMSFTITGTGSNTEVNKVTVDCTSPISGYTPIQADIFKYSSSAGDLYINTDYVYFVGNTAYIGLLYYVDIGSTANLYARVVYKKD